MKKRVIIIGPFPPPAGGVSIHLQRLTRLLSNDYDFDCVDESRLIKNEYFNLRRLNLISYLKKIYKADLVYIHSGPDILKIFHIVTGKLFLKKVILTIHAYPGRKILPLRLTDQLFFGMADTVIAVNSEITGRIAIPARKYIVMNAFLPPLMDEEPELPDYLKDWISTRRNAGKRIICSNAYRLDTYNNQDLYGLDLCIEAAKELVRVNQPVSFIFNVSVLDGFADLFNRYIQSINEPNLKDNFLLINESISFVKLTEQSDIVLRLTNTDGDALTVREALFLGKTIIASDVVQRPVGTILFKSRDLNDLTMKITESLNHMPDKSSQAINETGKFFRTYTDLMNKIMGIKKNVENIIPIVHE